MKHLYFIILFFSFLITNSFAENDPYQLLNEKQKALYYASQNCDHSSKQCLNILSRFYEEIKTNKKLSNTAYLGWSKYWYGYTMLMNKNRDEAYKIFEDMISNKIFDEKQNYDYKVYALIALGWAYFTEADKLNDKKSFNYMKQAADHGDPWALNNLGVFYQMGRNTKKDLYKAFESYKKSAKLGNHWAHGNLADFYLFGWGGADKNFQKSIFQMKFSSVATFSTNDNFKLKCLFKNAELPKNEKQLENWMIEYLIETKDVNGFQEIAWIVENNYEEEYKWQYLASIYSINSDKKERAFQELEIIEIRNNFTEEQIANIKNKAHSWIDINWE